MPFNASLSLVALKTKLAVHSYVDGAQQDFLPMGRVRRFHPGQLDQNLYSISATVQPLSETCLGNDEILSNYLKSQP